MFVVNKNVEKYFGFKILFYKPVQILKLSKRIFNASVPADLVPPFG